MTVRVFFALNNSTHLKWKANQPKSLFVYNWRSTGRVFFYALGSRFDILIENLWFDVRWQHKNTFRVIKWKLIALFSTVDAQFLRSFEKWSLSSDHSLNTERSTAEKNFSPPPTVYYMLTALKFFFWISAMCCLRSFFFSFPALRMYRARRIFTDRSFLVPDNCSLTDRNFDSHCNSRFSFDQLNFATTVWV